MKRLSNFIKSRLGVNLITLIVVLIVLGIFISNYDYNLSSTIHFNEYDYELIKEEVPNGLIVMEDTGHDGSKYYALSYLFPNRMDELIGGVCNTFQQRILNPILVKILSFGFPVLRHYLFIILNLLGVLMITNITYSVLEEENKNVLWTYAMSLNGVILSTIRFNLAEIVSIALIMGTLYYFYRKKNTLLASICCMGAVLTKENVIILVFILFLFELIARFSHSKKLIKSFLGAMPFVYGGAIFVLYHSFIYISTGCINLTKSGGHFSNPANVLFHITRLNKIYSEFANNWSVMESSFHIFIPIMFLSGCLIYGFVGSLLVTKIREFYKSLPKEFNIICLLIIAYCIQFFWMDIKYTLVQRNISELARLNYILFPLVFMDRNKNKYVIWMIIIINLIIFAGLILLNGLVPQYFLS